MKRLIYIIIATLLFPCVANAQWNFDFPTVEAYINDHKTQRSLLLARATLEQSNNLLHEYSADAAKDYKELNFDLDKYTRAFDVIDVLYHSLRTSMNAYGTYNTVKNRIVDYKHLLTDYHDKILKRGRFEITDTLIIRVNQHAIEKIVREGEHLYRSLSDLILYATGVASCSTSDLLMVLESINQSLDFIELHLNTAYFDTWRYIQVRIGYWKSEVYRIRSKREIVDGAFGRWRESGYKPGNPKSK